MKGKSKSGARGGKRRKVITSGKVKTRVSRDARRKLLALGRELDARQIKSARREANALGRKLTKLYKTEHIAFMATLERQRGYSALQREAIRLREGLLRGLDAAAGDAKKAARAADAHAKALRELMEANEAMLDRAYRRAIDETRMTEKLLSLVPATGGFDLTREKFGGATMRAFHHTSPTPTGLPAVPPLPTVLTAPYDDGATHEEKSLIGFTRAIVEEDRGRLDCLAVSKGSGGAAARTLVVAFVQLPSGHTVLKVSARIECDWNASALSLGAVSFAWTDAIVEVVDTDNTVRTAETPVDLVLAPIAWSVRHEGNDTFFVESDFAIPFTGGEFMIRAGVRCNAWSAILIADAGVVNRAEVDRIAIDVV